MVRIAMVGEDAMYTIGIVDAFRAEKLFKEAETFCRTQIDGADIVAINKIDLIDNGVRDKVSDLVRNITPKSKIVFISAKQAQGLESLLELLREAS